MVSTFSSFSFLFFKSKVKLAKSSYFKFLIWPYLSLLYLVAISTKEKGERDRERRKSNSQFKKKRKKKKVKDGRSYFSLLGGFSPRCTLKVRDLNNSQTNDEYQ